MDWDFHSTSVVILGAGFSAAASDGKMPLMTGYFDRLTREAFPELYDFVREVGCNRTCERIEQANVEKVLLALDQIRTSPAELLTDWLGTWKENLPLIQTQLSFYTLSRLSTGARIDPDNWAVRLLACTGEKTTVVSMNYDNIAERVLSGREGTRHYGRNVNCTHCKMRQLLERACSCSTRDRDLGDDWQGALLKPHGSIAWRRCLNDACCSYECLVADSRCRPFEPCKCPNCGTDCAPVMVLPTMSKNLGDMPEISTMWQASRLAMQNAESLVLFGFSLPASDELLSQMIRTSCSNGKRLKRIASIDLDPEAVLSRLDACLPPGYDVEMSAFPVVRGETPIWFNTESREGRLKTASR